MTTIRKRQKIETPRPGQKPHVEEIDETPSFGKKAFYCPHCGAYAYQEWHDIKISPSSPKILAPTNSEIPYVQYLEFKGVYISVCARCSNFAIWVGDMMVYPALSTVPFPAKNMPKDVKDDFLEARQIVSRSPRASAALLRLALQKLVIQLGEPGKNLNNDIGNLVKRGLPSKIQKALDSVRVIGNNAVHPGQIDLKDDIKTATVLFELLNMIVDVMITQPEKVDKIYEKIPESIKKDIEKRDRKM